LKIENGKLKEKAAERSRFQFSICNFQFKPSSPGKEKGAVTRALD
jgi:hypothetical protein